MKTLATHRLIQAWSLGAALSVAAILGLVASGCSTPTSGPTHSYGGISSKPWLRFEPIRGAEDIERLQPGDEVAMVCSKCKTVQVTKITSVDSKGWSKATSTGVEHVCPGCGVKIEVRPDKQTQIVHVCTKCGEQSAFCCVTRKGAPPTKGMEK